MMAVPQIWKRIFSRVEVPGDSDHQLEKGYIDKNFVDPFGQLLASGTFQDKHNFEDLVKYFTETPSIQNAYKVRIFVVADGAYVPAIEEDWYSNHVRMLALITKASSPEPRDGCMFIVGSIPLKGFSFLQCAGWDKEVLRFYAYDQLSLNGKASDKFGWVYQGNSWDAFSEGPSADQDTEYLGPFDGHVNGATIMKELHRPWYHWLTSDLDLTACLTKEQKTRYGKVKFLSKDKEDVFTGFDGPNVEPVGGQALETLVKPVIKKWMMNRLDKDFFSKPEELVKSPTNVRRWMAHLLLTTSINISTSETSRGDPDILTMMTGRGRNHFLNDELLTTDYGTSLNLLPDTSQFSFDFSPITYEEIREDLDLSLLQEIGPEVNPGDPWVVINDLPKGTLGGGRQTGAADFTRFVQVLKGEGEPFVILQPSYEDAQCVELMQQLDDGAAPLLSAKALRAILMLDFWNPVFSWRRGVLMQYVPKSTKLGNDEKTYDLEASFVAAIRQSNYAKSNLDESDKDKLGNLNSSPEQDFLAMYDKKEEDLNGYRKKITHYLYSVNKSIGTKEGLKDYLWLAESRRRVYRPLPLDEFGTQIPYAVGIKQEEPPVEMNSEGKIQPIPDRGRKFLSSWTQSLASFDPHLNPEPDDTVGNLPRATGRLQCPMRSLGKRSVNSRQPSNPTWEDDVKPLFATPSWSKDPSGTGAYWKEKMLEYSPSVPQALHIDLFDKDSVRSNVVTIYQHLRSKSMPITHDPAEYWPDWALETLKTWANQGFRGSSADPIQHLETIRTTDSSETHIRVRKDILSLTEAELQEYREKLDDMLKVGSLRNNEDSGPSKWQELGLLHAEWCLHYQEATFLWHRAYLKYAEQCLGCAIPYWNGFAKDTAKIDSPNAGIPKVFLEDEYIHSKLGKRKNPLKWALSLNGQNKQGTNRYVERYATLVAGNKDDPEFKRKINLFGKYHSQIASALSKQLYSVPELDNGIPYPWANLPAFTDDQPDSEYPAAAKMNFFDGLFEQAHDNYHGWVGPDMADNSYTAFDPIFLSYHANMDRIVESFLRTKPNQTLTYTFPLRPFTNNATDLAYDDPREYIYTTIGDMAKDTRAIGYLYAPPVNPDFVPLGTKRAEPRTKGGLAAIPVSLVASSAKDAAVTAGVASERKPYVIFEHIQCTQESYEVDVFVKGATSLEPDPEDNLDFIGRLTRIGMGTGGDAAKPIRNAGRCRKKAVTRVLEADAMAERLEKAGGIVQVVRVMHGNEVPEEEWKGWSGFEGRLVWA